MIYWGIFPCKIKADTFENISFFYLFSINFPSQIKIPLKQTGILEGDINADSAKLFIFTFFK